MSRGKRDFIITHNLKIVYYIQQINYFIIPNLQTYMVQLKYPNTFTRYMY